MKIKTLLSGTLILLSTFSFATGIDGNWHGKLHWYHIVINLKSESNRLTGFLYTSFSDHAVADGRISGNDFSFTINVDNKKVPVKGKIDGNHMSLTIAYPNNDTKSELRRLLPGTMPIIKPEFTEYYQPVPPVVNPGAYPGLVLPPSDAKVLFDGKDLSRWKSTNGGEAKWNVHDGVFTVNKGTGDIETRDVFNDFQLHIEWMVPDYITGKGQSRGNSGIFLQGLYEIQVLDSYQNETYTNGQAGSIYKQTPPLVNAMRKPGEWNVYDIIYKAPRFSEDGKVESPARVTVFHNGVLIQNNFEIQGNTTYIGLPQYTKHGKGPIKLQDHGDPSEAISYRNIWIREL